MLNQKVVFINEEKLQGAISDRAAELIIRELDAKIEKM